MRNVIISGTGYVPISEHWSKPLRTLMAEAGFLALNEAGISRPDLIIVSSAFASRLQEQYQLGSLIANYMGLGGTPAMSVEAGDASGGVAFHIGYMAVLSGLYDHVLIIGGDKLSDELPAKIESVIASMEDREYIAYQGATYAGLAALVYKEYLKKYGIKNDDVALMAVHDHSMAVGVSHAQYPFPVKLDKVLASPIIADPIRLFESFGFGDGAAAVVLSVSDQVKNDTLVAVESSAMATADQYNIAQRNDITSFYSSLKAAEQAYAKAKITPEKINVAEIHDSYTILGIIALEDLGFAKHGEATKLLKEDQLTPGGKIPTNTFGGLKARGHPFGATGLYQIIEVTKQLKGEAIHQIPKAEYGLVHSVAGIGGTATVSILRRVK
ncbi:MAG: thiolase domain-containing protein [Thermoprotei archaeon]